jgi:hypothetical protein
MKVWRAPSLIGFTIPDPAVIPAVLRLAAEFHKPEDRGREPDHEAGRAEHSRPESDVEPVARHAREKHRQSDRHDAGCPDHRFADR